MQIKVHERQRDNPPLSAVQNKVFTNAIYEDIHIDDISIAYLALDYHIMYPLYIQKRLIEMEIKCKGKKILLLLYANHANLRLISELSIITAQRGIQFLIAWRYTLT